MKRMHAKSIKVPTVKKPEHAPYPHRNLGGQLKAPSSGEYITETRYTPKGTK